MIHTVESLGLGNKAWPSPTPTPKPIQEHAQEIALAVDNDWR
jgi:hypothetical protein